MSATSLKSIVFILFAISLTSGEIVQNIVTKVADCFNCGMIEDVGQLDIKICGDLSCCFIQHMDNSEINFLAGKEDLFEGPASLLECYEYLISDSNGAGPMAVSVFHEGSDGLKLDYVEVGTDSRIVHCPIGVKLDNGEFYSTKCS